MASRSVDLPPRVERLRAERVSVLHGDGRLLIQEGSVNAYNGFFLPALLPNQTHVEQIGGPFPYVPLVFHRTTFDARSFLVRRFDAWNQNEIAARLHFLRVRWVAVHSGYNRLQADRGGLAAAGVVVSLDRRAGSR